MRKSGVEHVAPPEGMINAYKISAGKYEEKYHFEDWRVWEEMYWNVTKYVEKRLAALLCICWFTNQHSGFWLKLIVVFLNPFRQIPKWH